MSRQDRVRQSFSPAVNSRIDREAEGRIAYLLDQGSESISRRIEELDQEWDMDRALMALFPVLGGMALSAALLKNRKWFFLLGTQMSFLFYHATKGWCPPASLMRRMGFRTQKEIQAERQVLVDSLRAQLMQPSSARSAS